VRSAFLFIILVNVEKTFDPQIGIRLPQTSLGPFQVKRLINHAQAITGSNGARKVRVKKDIPDGLDSAGVDDVFKHAVAVALLLGRQLASHQHATAVEGHRVDAVYLHLAAHLGDVPVNIIKLIPIAAGSDDDAVGNIQFFRQNLSEQARVLHVLDASPLVFRQNGPHECSLAGGLSRVVKVKKLDNILFQNHKKVKGVFFPEEPTVHNFHFYYSHFRGNIL